METLLFTIIITTLINTLYWALYMCYLSEGGHILIWTISGMREQRLMDLSGLPTFSQLEEEQPELRQGSPTPNPMLRLPWTQPRARTQGDPAERTLHELFKESMLCAWWWSHFLGTRTMKVKLFHCPPGAHSWRNTNPTAKQLGGSDYETQTQGRTPSFRE